MVTFLSIFVRWGTSPNTCVICEEDASSVLVILRFESDVIAGSPAKIIQWREESDEIAGCGSMSIKLQSSAPWCVICDDQIDHAV